MRYHLNGIFVFLVIVLTWFLFGYTNVVPFDWLYNHRWYGLAGACVLGIVFFLSVVLPYQPVRKFFLADLFLGRIENLQLHGGRADAKMWLYLTGATMLALNVLSFTVHHLISY